MSGGRHVVACLWCVGDGHGLRPGLGRQRLDRTLPVPRRPFRVAGGHLLSLTPTYQIGGGLLISQFLASYSTA